MSTFNLSKIRAAVVVAAAITVTSLPPALSAQYVRTRTEVKVPFGFEAGSRHFAAGTYDISKPQHYVVFLQGQEQSSMIMGWHEINLRPANVGKLVFHHYGNRYFLREIWTANSSQHMTFGESNEEKTLRRNRMEDRRAAVPAPTDVEVALLEPPQ